MALNKLMKVLYYLAGLAILMCAPTLLGQNHSPSRVDIFTGYSWIHPGYDTWVPNAQTSVAKGYTVSATYFFTRYFGLGVDSGNHLGCCSPRVFTVTAGPTLRLPLAHVTPFAHALVGMHRMDLRAPFNRDTNYGVIVGGGLDVRVVRHLSLRLVQADYEYANHKYGIVRPSLNSVRISTGLVWQF